MEKQYLEPLRLEWESRISSDPQVDEVTGTQDWGTGNDFEITVKEDFKKRRLQGDSVLRG